MNEAKISQMRLALQAVLEWMGERPSEHQISQWPYHQSKAEIMDKIAAALNGTAGTETVPSSGGTLAPPDWFQAPDWAEAPYWATCRARDSYGNWYWFEVVPVKGEKGWTPVPRTRLKVARYAPLDFWGSSVEVRP